MNKKFLYHDKAYLYAKQGRISAYDFAAMSTEAYMRIAKETEYFNDSLKDGKWRKMMSMAPRELPVFSAPSLLPFKMKKGKLWQVVPEGCDTTDINKFVLPRFTKGLQEHYFVDIYLSDSLRVGWSATASSNWIHLSQEKGVLLPERGKNQVRLWVSVDWSKVSEKEKFNGKIDFIGAGKQYVLQVYGFRPKTSIPAAFQGFVENDGYVSIFAQHYTEVKNRPGIRWEREEGLGHAEASMMTALAPSVKLALDTAAIRATGSYLLYDIYTFTKAVSNVMIYTLPTLPLNKGSGMRYGICIDGGPIQVVDFASNSIARTEEWKQNVLSNTAVRKLTGIDLKPGKHTLKIFAIDPGVILDRIAIDLGGMKNGYGVIPETRWAH